MANVTPHCSEPFSYTLQLTDHDDARRVHQIVKDGISVNNFDEVVRQTRCPKIYVVRKGTEVLYVGYADQHMGSRLRYGLNPKHQKGYHGYGWKGEDEVELLVWVFDRFPDGTKKGEPYYTRYKRLIECVEAEIVYRVKEATGEWPKYQQEIHFGNDDADIVEIVTDKIMGYLCIFSTLN